MPLYTAHTGRSTPGLKTAVPYSVAHDIQVAADPQTSGHTVTLTVDGHDSARFVYEMLGYSYVIGSHLFRVLPEPSGRDGRAYCLKLESALHVPDDLDRTDPANPAVAVNSAGWPTYKIEAFRATYGIPLYNVLEDGDVKVGEFERFCVWRTKITAQNEKMPGGGFVWMGTNVKVSEVGVKTGRMLELTCKWLDVPKLDYGRLKGRCNQINVADVTWNGTTYDAETVLLTGVDSEPRVNAVGYPTFDITFTFAVRTDGRTWNKFWRSGADGYVEITSDGTTAGARPFQKTDLNMIWTFLP
jgi:hypothetical protein